MTTSAVSGSNPYSSLGLALQSSDAGAGASNEVSQQNFLTLLTAQLKNQDPMKPLDNTEFISQLAQISTVSGISSLKDSIDSLGSSLSSNQTLQAATLVGHKVLVAGSEAYLPQGGTLSGAADASSSGQVSVNILDASGQVVRTLDLGTQPAGLVNFSWDGVTSSGATAPAGTYTIQAQSTASNGSATALTTYGAAPVQGVEIANGGVKLDLTGLSAVPLSGVRQILQ